MGKTTKTALVTGASTGIGRAVAVELGRKGYRVGLVARRRERLEETKKMVEEAGGKAEVFVCDLADVAQVNSLIQSVKQWTDELDVLVNVAGVGVYKKIEEVEESEWDESFDLNVRASFWLTKGLLPVLQNPGSLVLNIGSGAGVIPMRGRSVYCATKFALRGLTLSLVEEFAGKSPSFCLITLGSTLTEFGPMTLEEKKKEFEKGRAYFPVEWVAKRLGEIIEDDKREVENTLYPGDHGFGEWKKP